MMRLIHTLGILLLLSSCSWQFRPAPQGNGDAIYGHVPKTASFHNSTVDCNIVSTQNDQITTLCKILVDGEPATELEEGIREEWFDPTSSIAVVGTCTNTPVEQTCVLTSRASFGSIHFSVSFERDDSYLLLTDQLVLGQSPNERTFSGEMSLQQGTSAGSQRESLLPNLRP